MPTPNELVQQGLANVRAAVEGMRARFQALIDAIDDTNGEGLTGAQTEALEAELLAMANTFNTTDPTQPPPPPPDEPPAPFELPGPHTALAVQRKKAEADFAVNRMQEPIKRAEFEARLKSLSNAQLKAAQQSGTLADGTHLTAAQRHDIDAKLRN